MSEVGAPKPRKKDGPLAWALLGLVFVVILGFVIYGMVKGSAADLKVGDCAKASGKVLQPASCGSGDAEYKVLSVDKKASQVSGTVLPCSGVHGATKAFWMGEGGDPTAETGMLICVKPK